MREPSVLRRSRTTRQHSLWRSGIMFVRRSEAGQGLAEYALILALIAIAAVMALLFLSGVIQSILSLIGNKL